MAFANASGSRTYLTVVDPQDGEGHGHAVFVPLAGHAALDREQARAGAHRHVRRSHDAHLLEVVRAKERVFPDHAGFSVRRRGGGDGSSIARERVARGGRRPRVDARGGGPTQPRRRHRRALPPGRDAGGGRRRAAEQTRAGPGERTKHRDARFGRPRARRPVSSDPPSPAELIIGRAVFGGATTRPNFGVWRGPRPVGNKIAPPRGPRRQSTPARPSSRTPGVVSPSSPYVVAHAVSALRRARLRGRGEVGRPRDRALPPAERRRRAVGTPSVLVRRAPRALRAAHLRRPRRHRFPPRRQRR